MGTRNSVFPRRVTLYVVGGKLRRRSSRNKEWPKTTKDQKAFMGEEHGVHETPPVFYWNAPLAAQVKRDSHVA